jgi:hypothetical protein
LTFYDRSVSIRALFMKLSYYLAFMVAAALLIGCGDKEAKVQQPATGAAATGSGTNALAKVTVTPAPPPPVTTTKPAASLFSSGGVTNAVPATVKPAADAKGQTSDATAKVVMVNKEMKFVVLEFSSSAVPTAGSQLSLYRGKERVATVKATEPMKPPLVTADILDGEVRKGDEVR